MEYKVGIIMPDFCDQRYLRDRDLDIDAATEQEAISKFKEYAFRHYLNQIERDAVNRGQIKIGLIK